MDIAEDAPLDEQQPAEGEAAPHPLEQLKAWADMPNVAHGLEEGLASRIASRVIEEYQIDKTSRSDWEDEAHIAMEAVLQKTEKKTHPFDGAANVKFPLLTTASLQFGARSYPAIVQGDRVVRVKTVGPDPYGIKAERAERISLHMSHQLIEEQDGWETDLDIMMHQLPVLGDGFRKVYRDHETGQNCSDFVSAMNVVVNQNTKDLQRVPRITQEVELYPYQIEERIRAETFVKFEYPATAGEQANEADGNMDGQQSDDDAPHLFLEQHRYWDLDEDGLPEPWIATVHKSSGKLVRLQANYDLDGALLNKKGEIARLPRYQYFVNFPFIPDPNGGFYGIGFGRLLKSIGETINTSINQMLDAAHLQNAGGGFVGSGLNTKKAKITVAMNEWTVVNVPGRAIRDAIVPHVFHGPSPELFKLLGLMIDAGKQIASVQEILTGDSGAKTMQPTTLLALIEQGLKVFTAIIKRVFRSLKREFGLLYELNRRFPDEEAYAEIIDWEPDADLLKQIQEMQQQGQQPGMGHNGGPPMDGGEAQPGAMPAGGAPPPGASPAQQPAPPPELPPQIMARLTPPTMQADYDHKDRNVVPIADPNAVTDMQSLGKAQVIQSTIGIPGVNTEEALRRIYAAAKIEDIDKLIAPTPQGPDPIQLEQAKVELRAKNAEAVKNISTASLNKAKAMQTEAEIGHTQAMVGQTQATTAKTQVEAQHIAQQAAEHHAGLVSGAVDADQELAREMQRQQINKLRVERELAPKMAKAKGGTA